MAACKMICAIFDDGFYGVQSAMAAGFFRVSAKWIQPKVLEVTSG